jgi:xylan 1,4-beta-xylosidase
MYHGYEKGYYNLGRQTLLEPIEWTDDGWFRVPAGNITDQPVSKPEGPGMRHGMPLSDDFSGGELGLQWRFYREFDPSRFSLSDGALTLKGKGKSPSDCGPLLAIPTNHAYEIQAEFEIRDGAVGGLVLFYDPDVFTGIGLSAGGLVKYERGEEQRGEELEIGKHAWLKIRNDHHQVSFFYSTDGEYWKRYPSGAEVSGYHHNAFGHFLSLRAGIFAAGEGTITCKEYQYIGLE